MDVKTFTIDDAAEWKEVLSCFPIECQDIYFTPDYYRSWRFVEDGEIYCFYAEYRGVKILYPFFKKKIDKYDIGNMYYDISSAYGYGGAIASNRVVDEDTRKKFADAISEWCQREYIVAEFIREYPSASVRHVGNTQRLMVRNNVFVDTSIDPESAWSSLPTNAKRNIRNGQAAGLEINIDGGLGTIDKFSRMYLRTASNRKFDHFYHFSPQYFDDVKTYLSEHSIIINAVISGEIVASVLCFHYGNKFTYHLGCSDIDRLKIRPNDFLYWAMITEAHSRGCMLLSLGGGMSTKDDDTLFRFKKKYASTIIPVYIETCVHNEKVYASLCRAWEVRHPGLIAKKGHYFMKYRETG